MKLDEIGKIYQSTNTEEVNEYLGKGYLIIKIFSTKTSNNEVEQVLPMYVLGLVKEKV